MEYQFLQPWHAFLPREGGHVISVFGGGGKTSLLAAWTGFYREEKIPVTVTTTTRTEPLHWPYLEVWEWADIDATASAPQGEAVFVRDGLAADGKWLGLTAPQVVRLGWQCSERIMLVESDGSAGRPVKLHRQGEPVWPLHTSLAVPVMGLAAVGEPTADVLHRHGVLPLPWALDPTGADLFTWDHMFRLLAGAGGYLERIPRGVPTVLVLTQLEDVDDSIGLFTFLDRVMTEARVPIVVLCELVRGEPRFQTAYRADAGEAEGGV
jgi:probable selenium-dependent hydroxylase accessory protein YqeC